ncbi:MAG TPA: hypothetical protein VK509_15035, partial [Polyangiales bacterium]|nr:hypothetical protein [Polyangiales bacterium]
VRMMATSTPSGAPSAEPADGGATSTDAALPPAGDAGSAHARDADVRAPAESTASCNATPTTGAGHHGAWTRCTWLVWLWACAAIGLLTRRRCGPASA